MVEVLSLFSDCLADKTFKVSRNRMTSSIVVDHVSLNDVILSVILKIGSPVLIRKKTNLLMRFVFVIRSSFCLCSSEFEIDSGGSNVFKKFSLLATFVRYFISHTL